MRISASIDAANWVDDHQEDQNRTQQQCHLAEHAPSIRRSGKAGVLPSVLGLAGLPYSVITWSTDVMPGRTMKVIPHVGHFVDRRSGNSVPTNGNGSPQRHIHAALLPVARATPAGPTTNFNGMVYNFTGGNPMLDGVVTPGPLSTAIFGYGGKNGGS
jgi:hypothetical protein